MIEAWVAMSALRRARLSRGISLLQAAVETGIPVGRLSRAERQLARLSKAERRRIAEFFSTDETFLFEEVRQ
jgi:transcriptional regulator with XRE-family HTH domain